MAKKNFPSSNNNQGPDELKENISTMQDGLAQVMLSLIHI